MGSLLRRTALAGIVVIVVGVLWSLGPAVAYSVVAQGIARTLAPGVVQVFLSGPSWRLVYQPSPDATGVALNVDAYSLQFSLILLLTALALTPGASWQRRLLWVGVTLVVLAWLHGLTLGVTAWLMRWAAEGELPVASTYQGLRAGFAAVWGLLPVLGAAYWYWRAWLAPAMRREGKLRDGSSTV